MGSRVRWSGLQRQVFKLHRAIIRVARDKDQQTRASILQYTRAELEKHRTIDRKEVMQIEHLLRKGGKQLDMIRDPSFTGVARA
mmetsp:Transcript_19749/g.37632  ORF Transcript_19749/g.37632 Transcript_19749/m.37632 type:complete len:84 (-) Transcript_19749:327-578(-)